MPTTRRSTTPLLLALLAVVFILRGPLTAVPPVLSAISDDLALSPVGAGLVTSLPLICFGVFAFLAPTLMQRLGRERALGLAVAVVVVGLVLRLFVTVPLFFAGTLVAGLGIAVANVVIPAIVRARFVDRLALTMGLYTVMIQISGSGGAFLTVPLMEATGWHWSRAIGIWLIPAVLALVAWLVASRATGPVTSADGDIAAPVTPMRTVAGRLLTWGIVLAMGLQSLVYYTMLTWLPAELVAQGSSVATAGLLLGLYNIVGLPGSFLGPLLVSSRHRLVWIGAVAAGYITGVTLIMTGTVAVLGIVLAGLCQGFSLSAALTLIARQRTAADVPAVSALAQGLGYLLAAVGPVTAGALYSLTGSFAAPDLLLIGVMAAWGIVSASVARAERSPS